MPTRPTAPELIDIFDRLFTVLGPAAFGVLDVALLHSGPDKNILREIFGKRKASFSRNAKKYSNFGRSSRQAKRLKAMRLEDARVGGALDALAIYTFFQDAYFPDCKLGEAEADKVWKYLSRKFAASLSGKVVTNVCGADPSRVFFSDELPELVQNNKIVTINNVPWKKIKDAYFSHPITGPQEAYKIICRSEIRLAWDRAKKETTSEAVEDFYYCRAYYRVARRKELVSQGRPVHPSLRKRTIKEHRMGLTTLKARLIPSISP